MELTNKQKLEIMKKINEKVIAVQKDSEKDKELQVADTDYEKYLEAYKLLRENDPNFKIDELETKIEPTPKPIDLNFDIVNSYVVRNHNKNKIKVKNLDQHNSDDNSSKKVEAFINQGITL